MKLPREGRMRRHAKTRFYLGCVLREAKEPLTINQLQDRLANYKETRRYMNNTTSLANLLKGDNGINVTTDYPAEYTMGDFEEFRRWIGLTDTKWRNIEKINAHYGHGTYRQIKKGERR